MIKFCPVEMTKVISTCTEILVVSTVALTCTYAYSHVYCEIKSILLIHVHGLDALKFQLNNAWMLRMLKLWQAWLKWQQSKLSNSFAPSLNHALLVLKYQVYLLNEHRICSTLFSLQPLQSANKGQNTMVLHEGVTELVSHLNEKTEYEDVIWTSN